MKKFKSEKKGLSEIVTSILIILIAVAAVVVIWRVLLPLITNPGEQSVSLADCSGNPISLSGATCTTANAITVQVSRLGSKQTGGVSVHFIKTDGSEESWQTPAIGAVTGTRSVTSTAATYGGDTVVISGNYTLVGGTFQCNIPPITVTCP